MEKDLRYAVLIDADNVAASLPIKESTVTGLARMR